MCIEVSSLMKCPYIISKIAGWYVMGVFNDNNETDSNQSFE